MVRLILASTSSVRRTLLKQAGLEFEAVKPAVDEAALKAAMMPCDPVALAEKLASAKAVSVANRYPSALVIGADQVLSFAGRALDKPSTVEAARDQLKRLRGREHWLETAICCARGNRIAWRHAAQARLTMRAFSDDFLEFYLDRLGPDVVTSVGGYKLEGLGIQLFDSIEGDYFAILGLPLLPLLGFLRSEGAIPS
jgi:nucleoside triphosphate pyrophosphatase